MNLFKTAFLFVMLLLFSNASAQLAMCPKHFKEYKNFWESTTLVVLYGEDSAYSDQLKESIEKRWKHTPYQFISAEEYENNSKYSKSGKYSVIHMVAISLTETTTGGNAAGSSTIAVVPCLALEMNIKRKVKTVKPKLLGLATMDNIEFGDYVGTEPTLDDIVYRLDHMVQFIHDAVTIVKEENIAPKLRTDKTPMIMMEYFQKQITHMKGKVLLIEKSAFDKNIDKDAFRKYMKKKNYKVVDKEIIAKAIEEKDEKYCYLNASRDPSLIYFIVSASDAKVYYANAVGSGLLKYKKIGKKHFKKWDSAF